MDRFTPEDCATLLRVARQSIEHGLAHDRPLQVPPAARAGRLGEPAACFVSLYRGDELRGCIGAIAPSLPLVEQAADSAFSAAFRDHRFPALARHELDGLRISVHVLGPLQALPVTDLASLYAALRPGADGLVLHCSGKQAVFLPVMWEQLPTPEEFVGQLLRKAGIRPGDPIFGLRAERFAVEVVEEGLSAER
jgi:AmmeMemoRadiSam system protein A